MKISPARRSTRAATPSCMWPWDEWLKSEKDAKKPSSAKKGALAESFGWLHVDTRTPLPKLTDLNDVGTAPPTPALAPDRSPSHARCTPQACQLVAPDFHGHRMYLCSDAAKDSSPGPYALSNEFTKFYGAPVYVCEGPQAESTRRGWDFE